MKRYDLQYWAYNPDNESQLVLRCKEVLASDDTIESLTSDKKQPFYKFIIADGQDYILDTDCIHSLTSVIDWGLSNDT